MADCCTAEPEQPKPVDAPSGAPPDSGEAKAKAAEYNDKVGEAKKEAAADGKTVGPDPPKVTPAAPPAAKAPAALPAPAAQSKDNAKKPAPAEGAKGGANTKGAPGGASGAPGPAAAGAQASIDGEVADFFKKSPKDQSKEALNNDVKQLVAAAASLQAHAPPIGAEKKDDDKGNLAKLSDAITGANSPYKDLGGKYSKWIQTLSRIRDVFSSVSGILGTVGTVLSILGLIISLTGIGAPLGGPIEVIGNVITVVCLVMDAITLVLSAIIQGLLLATLTADPTPDPETRKKLAGMIKEEAANTAQALLSVVMALPGVNKLAEVGLGKLGGLVKTILSKLGKAAVKAIGPIAKRIAAAIGTGLKKLLKVGEGAAVKSAEKGAMKAAMEKAVGYGAKAFNVVVEKGGAFMGKARSKINGKLEGYLAKAEDTWAGKAAKKVGEGATKVTEGLEKYTGGEAVEKMGKSFDYYMDKMGNKLEGTAGRLGEKGAEGVDKMAAKAGLGPKQADAAAVKAADSTAVKAAEKDGEQAAEKAVGSEAKAGEKAAGSEAKAVDSAATKSADQAGAKSADQAAGKGGVDTEKELEKAKENASEVKEFAGGEKTDKYIENQKTMSDTKSRIKNEQKVKKLKSEAGELAECDEKIERLESIKNRSPAQEQELADTKGEMDIWKMDKDKAAAYNEYKKTEKELEEKAEKKVEDKAEKDAQDAANFRNKKRMENAKEGKSDPKLDKDEFKDSMSYEKEGITGEKSVIGKVMEKKDDIKDFTQMIGLTEEGGSGPAAEIKERQEKDEKLQQIKEYLEKHPATAEEMKKGDPAVGEKAKETADEEKAEEGGGGGGPAPKLAGGEAKGGSSGRVGTLLQDMEPKSKGEDAQKNAGHPGGAAGGEGGGGHPAEGGGGEQAPAQAQGGGGGDAGGGAPGGGAPGGQAGGGEAGGGAGQIPYWPELLKEYQDDLTQLGTVEQQLGEYKSAQLAGYKQAVGIEEGAEKKKGEAEGRKKTTDENVQHSDEDAGSLKSFSGKNREVSGKGDQANDKKGEAKSKGDEGSQAADAQVPDPPEESWWKAILNAIKNYILGLLAKGMKWIQDGITKIVMGIMGIDPAKVKELTECQAGQGDADSAKSKEAGAETKEGGAKDDATKSQAEEKKSEAKQLQEKTQQNIKSADDLLGTVAQVKAQLQQEIQAGNQYLQDVNAAVANEKKENEEKDKAEEKKQAEAAEKQKKEQDDKKKGDDQKADEADPMQVARLKQAAMIVKQADTENASKLETMMGEASGTFASGPLSSKNPGMVSEATGAFNDAGGDALSEFHQGVAKRGSKLDSVTGNGKMTTAQVGEAVQSIEQAASESDQAFEDAASQIESNFGQCYTALNKPKKKKGEAASTPAMA